MPPAVRPARPCRQRDGHSPVRSPPAVSAWPVLLSKKLDLPVENHSVRGSSNEQIVHVAITNSLKAAFLQPTRIRKNVTSPDIWNTEFDDTGHEISFSNDKMNPGAYTQGDLTKQENTLKRLLQSSYSGRDRKPTARTEELQKKINILRNAREDTPVDRKTAIKNYAYMILMMQRTQNESSTITNSALMQGIMIVENKLLKK